MGSHIDAGEHVLPLMLLADPELVVGGEGNPAALAHEANIGNSAL